MQTLGTAHNMKPGAESVLGNDVGQRVFLLQFTAIGKQTKNRIVDDHGRRRPQRAVKAEIDFSGIPPGPATHLFVAKPSPPPRPGFESTACAAVVLFAGIPVA